MKTSITVSFLWDFFGKIGSQIISFGLSIFLARLLGPKDYGLISLATIFISLTSIFSNFGLGAALIQKDKPTEAHYSSTFFFNILLSVILFSLFFFGAPFIQWYFNEPQLGLIVRALSVGIILSAFNIVQNVHFVRKMLFKKLTSIKLINTVISGIIGLVLAINNFGVWSLVFQTLTFGLLNCILLWYFSDWKPKLIFKWEALKELWVYGFKMFLSGIIDTIYNQVSSLIIAKFFSAKELGLYNRAESLNRFVIKYSSESVGSVTFPAMAKMQSKVDDVIALGKKTEIIVAFLSFGLLGLLYVTSESLILFMLGNKWIECIPYYKILCLSGFAYPISAATLSILKATGNSAKFLKVEVYKKIVGLIGLAIGFYFGINGYLVSLIFTGLISVLLNMYFVSLAVPFSVKNQLSGIYIYVVISLICATIVFYLPMIGCTNFVNLALQTILYILFYAFLNFLFKTDGSKILKQLMIKILDR